MSDSQENIEARLLAYLEGELDLGERAEIEKHLAANPTHRKLLEELSRTRQFVQQLPRATAPAELVDQLQGQLERSALLDGIGVDEQGTLQIGRGSRWPQIISVAAVVLLAVGLGAVVFVALPRDPSRPTVARDDGKLADTNDGSTTTAAVAPTAGTRPKTTISTITLADASRSEELAKVSESIATSGPVTPVTPDVVAMAAGQDNEQPAVDDSALAITTATPAPAAAVGATTSPASPAAPALASTAPIEATAVASAVEGDESEAPLVVVVSSADIAVVNTEVASFFARNNIAYENMEPALPTMADGLKDNSVALKLQTDNTGAAGGLGSDDNRAPASARELQALQQQYGAGVAGENRMQVAQSQQKLDQQVLQLLRDSQEAQSPAPNQAVPRVANQYLAKRMSRSQVSDLQTALAAPASIQLLERVAQPADVTNAPAASEPALLPGEQVEVTVDELVGPGVERTSRLRISNEGTIAMPMLPEAVEAQGLTSAELADSISRRYRDASLIDKPTVRVSRVTPTNTASTQSTTGPATNPTAQFGASGVPTTAATTLPVAAQRAANASDSVNVVIVVQSVEPLVPSATLPTTSQPTTAPSATTTTAPAVPVVTTMPVTQPATMPAQ